jgi:MerR family copper efflux transcriptional regulator
MSMNIGEVAAAAGVNVQTVRYYERRGILPPPGRTMAGYRNYEQTAITRVRFVKRAQELGFSLDEIQDLLNLRVDDPRSCGALELRVQHKLSDVNAKIAELRRLKRALEGLAAACAARTRTPECPVLEMLAGDMRRA